MTTILKTTTSTTYPPRYYSLPVGTQFALIGGAVRTLAEMQTEMGPGVISLGCFYPASDPLRRGYRLRVREVTA